MFLLNIFLYDWVVSCDEYTYSRNGISTETAISSSKFQCQWDNVCYLSESILAIQCILNIRLGY